MTDTPAATLLVANAMLADGGGPVDIVAAGPTIVEVRPHGGPGEPGGGAGAGRLLDAGGRTVIPGLIDVHVHGGGGADVMDATPEAVATVGRSLARQGTTAYLGTTFLRPTLADRHLSVLGEAAAGDGPVAGGARLLGIHLEGPFVSHLRRGGILADAIAPASHQELDRVLDLTAGALRMMTIAPELDGAIPLVERLTRDGVVASFGHSDADYDQTRAGIAAGIRHATHLYNAMRGLHHRDPGPLLALHEADELTVQLISDGVHVDGRVVRWTRDVFGHSRCVCVTDGIRTTGLPDGEYTLGGLAYSSHDGVARYGDGTLIGTSLPLLEVVRRFARYTGCSLAEAAQTASLHAARALGIQDRKGSIETGKDADLVVLDGDGAVGAAVVEGNVVYVNQYSGSDP